MGLFSIITIANTANEFLSDKVKRTNLINASVDGFNKICECFDSDNTVKTIDKVGSDKDNFPDLLEYSCMIASILGQTAIADDVVQESEEETAWNVLFETCFEKGGVFSAKELADYKTSRKELKTKLMEKFHNPYGLKKIAKYAIIKEIEEQLYKLACIVVGADELIKDSEREFLNELGSSFELSKFDIKRIEKECLSKISK